MTTRARLNSGSSQLILSLFPGIDLLGRGFEDTGFCVVRGPDTLFGGDVRRFSVPHGRFDGVIAGTPCQDFSRARRTLASGIGLEMLAEFQRIVLAAAPAWWLLENVPACPDVKVAGYSHQRIDVDARDVGSAQRRLRHFQYGNRKGLVLCLPRPQAARSRAGEPTLLASRSGGRDFADFCRAQGLDGALELPAFTLGAKYRAVGNGVHLGVARMIASAVLNCAPPHTPLCYCGCGRPVCGKAESAGPACRKRVQRQRDRAGASGGRRVTAGQH